MNNENYKLQGNEKELRQASVERVKARTMARIQGKARRTNKTLIRVLAAAAAVAMLTTGAIAASGLFNTRNVDRELLEAYGDYPQMDQPGVGIEVQKPVRTENPSPESATGETAGLPSQDGMVAFTMDWLPENETYTGYFSILQTVENYAMTGRELQTEMSDETLDNLYNMIDVQYGADKLLKVTSYSAGQYENREFLSYGDVRVVKEGELNGREAIYLEGNGMMVYERHILLYDPALCCVVHVCGMNNSFAELEQAAQAVRLVQTDVVLPAEETDWHWNMLSVSCG